MGFRISLYRVPNEIVDKYRGFTEEDYETDDKGVMLDELEKECIKYDTLTDVIMSDRNENFSTRLFKNKLEIESDMYFGTISQQQLLNIIEDVRVNHIIKWFDGRRVDKDKLGDYWTKPSFFLRRNGQWTPDEAKDANQGEWNIKADSWKYQWKGDDGTPSFLNINLRMNDKWTISGGNAYEYLIFDLIHILKIFDWEKDTLVCIGG